MENNPVVEFSDLEKEDLIRMVGIFVGDLLVHYGMWFTETVRSQGIKTALELDHEVLNTYYPLAAKRLAGHLGIEMDGDVPKVLKNKSREELLALLSDIAKTWVVSDGLWFQALEKRTNMDQAKQVEARFAVAEMPLCCGDTPTIDAHFFWAGAHFYCEAGGP